MHLNKMVAHMDAVAPMANGDEPDIITGAFQFYHQ